MSVMFQYRIESMMLRLAKPMNNGSNICEI